MDNEQWKTEGETGTGKREKGGRGEGRKKHYWCYGSLLFPQHHHLLSSMQRRENKWKKRQRGMKREREKEREGNKKEGRK